MTFRFEKTFRTGHEIFDEISGFQIGSTICIFDETHIESLLFLEALLSKMKDTPICLLASQQVETSFRLINTEIEKPLNDINLSVAKLREEVETGIIIHHYLPHILLRVSEDEVLKMLEYWMQKISGRDFVELFTLPKETYPTFEKRLKAISDAVINITITKVEETYQQSFSFMRGSKLEYRLTEFPYKVEDGRLLIKWREDEYLDYLPKEEEAEIKRIKQHLMDNLYELKIKKGASKSFKTEEFLLLSHLIDKRLLEIQELFPERFDSIVDTLARWKIRGYIGFEKTGKIEPKPLKGSLKLSTRIALKFPASFAVVLLRLNRQFRKEKIRYIPYDGYLSLKSSAETLIRMISSERPEMIEKLLDSEVFMQEIVGRKTAVEHIKSLGESPLRKFDTKYIPKICCMALYQGYGLWPSIREVESNIFEITLKDCIMCENMSSEGPVCHMISSTIVGVLSVMFKRMFVCVETECRAKGDDKCSFELKIL